MVRASFHAATRASQFCTFSKFKSTCAVQTPTTAPINTTVVGKAMPVAVRTDVGDELGWPIFAITIAATGVQ